MVNYLIKALTFFFKVSYRFPFHFSFFLFYFHFILFILTFLTESAIFIQFRIIPVGLLYNPCVVSVNEVLFSFNSNLFFVSYTRSPTHPLRSLPLRQTETIVHWLVRYDRFPFPGANFNVSNRTVVNYVTD